MVTNNKQYTFLPVAALFLLDGFVSTFIYQALMEYLRKIPQTFDQTSILVSSARLHCCSHQKLFVRFYEIIKKRFFVTIRLRYAFIILQSYIITMMKTTTRKSLKKHPLDSKIVECNNNFVQKT